MNISPVFRIFVVFAALISFQISGAQEDTLVLNNDDVVAGELKKLDKGVATIETDYSKSDFKIKWKKLKGVWTRSEFLILVKEGKRYHGRLQMENSEDVALMDADEKVVQIPLDEIVYLSESNPGFLNNFEGELSVGYNFTKAENNAELNIQAGLGYHAKNWNLKGAYNDSRSSRNDAKSVKRIEGGLNFQYFLKNNWFTTMEVSFFSNTEQKIKLRTLVKPGIGKFITQTNKLYWGVQAGVTYNNENYRTLRQEDFKNSSEAFLGTELNLFDISDFDLLTKAVVYPSLTESGRWRVDYNIDIKYDLPLDFFIKLGFKFNYDNEPVVDASKSDYIFQTTIGWDFD